MIVWLLSLFKMFVPTSSSLPCGPRSRSWQANPRLASQRDVGSISFDVWPSRAGPQTCRRLQSSKSNYSTGPSPLNTSTVTTFYVRHKCQWDYSGFSKPKPSTLCKLARLWYFQKVVTSERGKRSFWKALVTFSHTQTSHTCTQWPEVTDRGRQTSVPNQKLQREGEEVVKLTEKA